MGKLPVINRLMPTQPSGLLAPIRSSGGVILAMVLSKPSTPNPTSSVLTFR